MQIIINAGGTGTRLWPLSTSLCPKQFTGLIDEQNFVQKTYQRLQSHFSPEQIWLSTNQKFEILAKNSLPKDFNPQHLLLETQKRDTFASIIAQTAVVAHFVGADEPLIFVASDHLIDSRDVPKFNQGLVEMAQILTSGQFELVIAGVKPTFANTELGYIEIAKEQNHGFKNKNYTNSNPVLKVQRFREKPDLISAQQFLDSGSFLWNLGYFALSYNVLKRNLQTHWPELIPIIEKIHQTGQITPELYNQIPKNSIDFALVEKLSNIRAVQMSINWQDIGNWDIVKDFLPEVNSLEKTPAEENNSELTNQMSKFGANSAKTSQEIVVDPHFVQVGGSGNKIKSSTPNRKIALIGVSDLLIVESEAGLLIIDPKKAPLVKKVVEYFEDLDK